MHYLLLVFYKFRFVNMEIHNAIYLLFLLFFSDTVADVHILQVLTFFSPSGWRLRVGEMIDQAQHWRDFRSLSVHGRRHGLEGQFSILWRWHFSSLFFSFQTDRDLISGIIIVDVQIQCRQNRSSEEEIQRGLVLHIWIVELCLHATGVWSRRDAKFGA